MGTRDGRHFVAVYMHCTVGYPSASNAATAACGHEKELCAVVATAAATTALDANRQIEQTNKNNRRLLPRLFATPSPLPRKEETVPKETAAAKIKLLLRCCAAHKGGPYPRAWEGPPFLGRVPPLCWPTTPLVLWGTLLNWGPPVVLRAPR